MSKAGQDIFIRMASSESDLHGSDGKKGKALVISVTLLLAMVLLALGLILYLQRGKKKLAKQKKEGDILNMADTDEHHKKDLELPLHELSRIIKATNNFSLENMLGEGGFGPVYKVKLMYSDWTRYSQIQYLAKSQFIKNGKRWRYKSLVYLHHSTNWWF